MKYENRDIAWTMCGFLIPTRVILMNKEICGDSWWVNIQGSLTGFSVLEKNLFSTKKELLDEMISRLEAMKYE